MEIIHLILLFLIGTISSILYFLNNRYSYWKNRGVPFIEPNFIYGNLKDINRIHLKDFLCNIYEKFKGIHPFVGAYFFIDPVVIVTDLDLVRNIVIKDFNFFSDRGTFYNEKDDPLSANLFNLDGQKWKNLRGKLSPTFTSGKMKFMFNTVVDVAKEFDKTLSMMISKECDIEMREISGRFTTDVIGSCAFGIECNSLKDPNAEFRVVSSSVFENPKFSRYVLLILAKIPRLAKFFRIKAVRNSVHTFFMRVVRETVEYREKNNIRRNDFMDLLIQLKNNETLEDTKGEKLGKLSLEEIAAQGFVFFLAGFETSSTTMGYALYELALNPDIQEKARKEIYEVLGKHKELTYEAMLEMSFLDQVISETLRKYPPGTTLIRKTLEDYQVPNTKFVIEKGTTVFIPVYAFHHDKNIYPDPEKFDPDRFSSEMIKQRHSLSFLAFGEGPRNCIGLRFGRMQARIGLVTLLQNYKFSKCSKTQIPLTFSIINPILAPEGGIFLKVERL